MLTNHLNHLLFLHFHKFWQKILLINQMRFILSKQSFFLGISLGILYVLCSLATYIQIRIPIYFLNQTSRSFPGLIIYLYKAECAEWWCSIELVSQSKRLRIQLQGFPPQDILKGSWYVRQKGWGGCKMGWPTTIFCSILYIVTYSFFPYSKPRNSFHCIT